MQKIVCMCVVFFLITFPLFTKDSSNDIFVKEIDSNYSQFLVDTYPSKTVKEAFHSLPYREFPEATTIESYYSQAKPITDEHQEYSFFPHHIQTIVIAVDLDQTNEEIKSFSDVLQSDLPVNFSFGYENSEKLWDSPESQHIVTTMAKALHGFYDIYEIAKDFHSLEKTGRFFANDPSLPISILYDSDAVALIEEGRNLRIVIPSEGTQSFISGILSKDHDFSLDNIAQNSLISYKLRSLLGFASSEYPPQSEYDRSHFINDLDTYNEAATLVGPVLRRYSFEYERYGFSNNRERTVVYLLFLLVIVFYIISINRRLTNKRIRMGVVAVCVFQIMLVTMGCLKALITDNAILETVLWYGYYLAFVAIPALYLYIALISGKNSEVTKVPLGYKIYILISVLLVFMVWTNNLHGFVFTVYDYTNSTFDYTTGYYIVMTWIHTTVCVALAILMYKVIKMPRKSALVLPLIMNIFTIMWLVGYARRIPLFYDLDVAYSINIIILLYLEACIQSKLFPSNTHYRKMFANSKLSMEIRDKLNNTVEKAYTSFSNDKDYVLRTTSIDGGSFLYYEDYTDVNKIREKLRNTNEQLKQNNEFLKKESEVRAELASLAAEKLVYKNIDGILSRDTKKIDKLLRAMEQTNDTYNLMSIINIIVCGIKRKCILRINTLYKQKQSVEDFLNYIGEMQEFASPLPLKITIGCQYAGSISIMQAMGMYELFCAVVECSAVTGCSDIVVQMYEENERMFLSIIPDTIIDIKSIDYEVKSALEFSGGVVSVKPIDDTSAVLLSFYKERSSID